MVIGAGLAGVATAYYLTRHGVAPLVLEKDEVGAEQSSRAWGFVRQQERDPLELPLMMASNALWRDLQSELDADLEFTMSGNLGIARHAHELEAYRSWQAVGDAHGLETRLVSADEVRELLPGIRGEWSGGLLTPSDGHASPPKTTAAYAVAARRGGASIETGCASLSIDVRAGRVRGVRTEKGYVATERVVCATGAWSSRVLRPVGIRLPQLRVRFHIGALFLRDLADRALPRRIGRDRARRWAVGTAPTNRRGPEHALRTLKQLFDAAHGLILADCWSCYMDITPDMLPVLGPAPGIEGLTIATGLSGHGFAMAPIVGKVSADSALGEDPGFNLDAFSTARWSPRGRRHPLR